MRRLLKQLFFAAIFFGIVGGFTYLLVFKVLYPPSCTDKIKNQGEEGVDCGGPCAPCEIKLLSAPIIRSVVYFVDAKKSTVDLAAEIKNPNALWGTAEIRYQFILLGEGDAILTRVRGTTYLLPGEARWVMELAKFSPGTIRDVKFEVQKEEIPWQKLKPFAKDVSVKIENPVFKKFAPPAIGFAEVRGSVANASSFTLAEAEVDAVLFDSLNRVVAVGKTVLGALGPGTRAPFRIFWPLPFEGEVVKTSVAAYTNLLSDANFLQRYSD